MSWEWLDLYMEYGTECIWNPSLTSQVRYSILKQIKSLLYIKVFHMHTQLLSCTCLSKNKIGHFCFHQQTTDTMSSSATSLFLLPVFKYIELLILCKWRNTKGLFIYCSLILHDMNFHRSMEKYRMLRFLLQHDHVNKMVTQCWCGISRHNIIIYHTTLFI